MRESALSCFSINSDIGCCTVLYKMPRVISTIWDHQPEFTVLENYTALGIEICEKIDNAGWGEAKPWDWFNYSWENGRGPRNAVRGTRARIIRRNRPSRPTNRHRITSTIGNLIRIGQCYNSTVPIDWPARLSFTKLANRVCLPVSLPLDPSSVPACSSPLNRYQRGSPNATAPIQTTRHVFWNAPSIPAIKIVVIASPPVSDPTHCLMFLASIRHCLIAFHGGKEFIILLTGEGGR